MKKNRPTPIPKSSYGVLFKDVVLKSTGPASVMYMLSSKIWTDLKKASSYYPKEAIDYYFPGGSSPSIYGDIGIKARDLLYDNYNVCHKLSLSKNDFSGSLSTTEENGVLGLISYKMKYRSLASVFKVLADGTVHYDSTVESVAHGLSPGLSCLLTFRSDMPNNKITVQSLNDYAAISATVGILNNPIISIDSTFGSNVLGFGLQLSFNTLLRFATVDLATCYNNTENGASFSFSLIGNANIFKASYFHTLGHLKIGGEFSCDFVQRRNFLTLGLEKEINSDSSVRVRVRETGAVNVVFRCGFLTVSSEVLLGNIGQAARVGIAIAI